MTPLAIALATADAVDRPRVVVPAAAGAEAVNARPTVVLAGAVMTGAAGAAMEATDRVAGALLRLAALTSVAVIVIVPTAPAV